MGEIKTLDALMLGHMPAHLEGDFHESLIEHYIGI